MINMEETRQATPRPPLRRRVVVAVLALAPIALLVGAVVGDGTVELHTGAMAVLLAWGLGGYAALTYVSSKPQELRGLSAPGEAAGACPDCGGHHPQDERLIFTGEPQDGGGHLISHMAPDLDPPCNWSDLAEDGDDAQAKIRFHMEFECPRREIAAELRRRE